MTKYIENLDTEIICGYTVSAKMKKVWNIDLGCLEEVKRICKQYNLRYYAIAGTLLGAIRHKGFIPWDDDIDLGMPRKDYEIFIDIAVKELKSPYFLQTYKTERRFTSDMAKLRNSNSTGFTECEAVINCNKGIFIDIFPIDNEPDDDLIRKKENREHLAALRNIDRFTRKYPTSGKISYIKELIKKPVRLFCSQSMKERMLRKVINSSAKYNFSSTKYCGMRTFSLPEKYRWETKDCKEFIKVPFENTTIVIPKGYDNILKSIYGDYMKFEYGGSCHEGTTYDPDIPYLEYLGKNK